MEINLEDVKTFAEIAKPIIEPLISSLIKPKITRLNQWILKRDKEHKIEDNFWENKFSNYLENLYNNCLYIPTLVFPNSRTKIKELYVPLTLEEANKNKRYIIEVFDFNLFKEYNKIIISDYAGMGKSTILKWITVSIIEQNKSIPILIELRKVDRNNSLINEIINQINPIDKTFDKDLIYELLSLGSFTILLDGFDEIPFDIQYDVTVQMSDFIKKSGKNNFIITSRPEPALSTFADFQLFNIKPLENKEAFEIIGKLDLISNIKIKDNLISEVHEKNAQVKEFLSNPFLVSLLYKSYTFNRDIPSKKINFYEEVYSCLFKNHDLTKEGYKRPKKSNLDIFDFEVILRDIAFETSKIGRVIYTKDEFINYIKEAKQKSSIEFNQNKYYEDLLTTVPLFIEEGQKIKWAHKSIQDFFSAKFISNHVRKEEIIFSIYKSEKHNYLNIIDLLFELEPKVFRKKITKNILESFITFYESQFQNKPKINQKIIDERIGLSFAAKFCILKIQNDIDSFEINVFDNARSIFAKAINGNDNFNAGITLTHSRPAYYFMNEYTFIKQIIIMLKEKNENIFFDKIQNQRNEITTLVRKLQDNIPYVIDDDCTALYNKENVFQSISYHMNSRLQKSFTKLNYSLDYAKCSKYLKIIELEINDDESMSFLINI